MPWLWCGIHQHRVGDGGAIMPPHWLRALQHLKQYNPENVDYVAPFALTQDGIAAALGITRPHASLILKRLIGDGLVEKRLVYICGGSRRRQAYVISRSGIMAVRAM